MNLKIYSKWSPNS